MIAVIFEAIPSSVGREQYLEIAHKLRPQLDSIDGFISLERFESLYVPGKILSLSFWRDDEAVRRWREATDHKQAQEVGKREIFDDYRIRVASVLRDYGKTDRQEAPTR